MSAMEPLRHNAVIVMDSLPAFRGFDRARVIRTASVAQINICDKVRQWGHEYHAYRAQRPEAETEGNFQACLPDNTLLTNTSTRYSEMVPDVSR
jgi:hypothetical protein